MQRHIKTFESFNEGLLQKAVDFVKDPSGKKRAAAAAEEEERDNANRARAEEAEEAERAIKRNYDDKEKEYRSKLSPEQLKKLEDYEEAEYRHARMLGEPSPDYLGQDGYFRHFHTRKNN